MTERPHNPEQMLDERIDAVLRQRFAPPPAGQLRSLLETLPTPPGVTINGIGARPVRLPVEGSAPARRVLRGPGRARWAAAAALVLAALGAWLIWGVLGRPANPGYGPWRSFETVYRDAVAGGFRPDWVCRTDREFQDTFWNHYRQRLLLETPPPRIETLGLSYCRSMSPQTVCLLARVQGRDVMVFVDRIERDPDRTAADEAGLHLFRRRIGRLVLYEMTPLEQPFVLDLLHDPGDNGRQGGPARPGGGTEQG